MIIFNENMGSSEADKYEKMEDRVKLMYERMQLYGSLPVMLIVILLTVYFVHIDRK